MLSNKIDRLCQKILEISFGLFFTITPLIFTTVNYELFEFNKMVFVYFITILILGAWLGKMVLQQKIIFKKTVLFWPLIIFLASQVVTTITSIDRHTSFWGYYTRQNGGLLSTLTYTILYFALVSNDISSKKIKKYLNYSLITLTLVSLYGLFQKLGIDKNFWTQDVRARVFSTLGQPNWLAAWISSLIFLVIAQALLQPKNFYLLTSVFTLAYTILLFTRSRSGFLAFWLVYPLFWLALAKKNSLATISKKSLLSFTFLALALTIIFLSPFPQINRYLERFSPTNPQSLPKWSGQDNNTDPDLGSATADIRKTVWQGAISIFKNYPILGTGPETFAYTYYWYQPKSHNLLSEWDFLYNKAHNEYLNYLSNTGLVGFLSYSALIIATTFYLILLVKKEGPNWLIHLGLLCGYLTILITNFFGFSVVAINIWFFLIPAISYCLESQTKTPTKYRPVLDLKQKSLLVIVFLIFLNLIFSLSCYWLADYYFTQAERKHLQGQYSQAHLLYQQARKLNPKEPLYPNKMAYNCAYLSVLFHQEKNTQEANNFTSQAESLAKETIKMNRYHLDFYRQQSQTYYLLSQIDPKFLKNSQQLLLEAHRLAPTSPKITYNLAVLAYNLNDLEQGISWLEKTTDLKPDYQEAYYWLAKFYQENGQNNKALETLDYLLNHLNPNHQEGKKLLEEILRD